MMAGLAVLVLSYALPAGAASEPHVAVLKLDGVIDSVNAGFLSRGIEKATEEQAEALIVLLDTPGGILDSTRDMVEEILAAEIPVIVYVSPPGAQAASAGTFVLAAGHLAAMAPSTNVGAASPVTATGEDLPDTLKAKATQDASAFLRSIAEERGRDADAQKALEETVLKATAYSSSEALELEIIDLIAADVDDLLSRVHGRKISLATGDVVLATAGLEVREIGKTPVERFLSIVADPNIALLLLSIGGLAIMIEVLNPGSFGPGIIGIIALALAFVALGNLPVNWVGVGLILFGIILFYLEIQASGIGLFGIAGGFSFVLGAFLLVGGFGSPPIPTPGFRVAIWVIVGIAVAFFGALILLSRLTLSARDTEPQTTIDRVLGQLGVVTSDLAPRGIVQVAGEPWTAVVEDDTVISAGEAVKVIGLDGLTLRVSRSDENKEVREWSGE